MLTYKDLLFASDSALCIVNKELKIIDCNYSMGFLTGLDISAITGQSLSNIICDDGLIESLSSNLVVKKRRVPDKNYLSDSYFSKVYGWISKG